MGERHDEADPLERLRALDRAIARRGASVEAREAVRRRLQRHAVEQPFHVRLRWWPAVAFAAGAITMAFLLLSDGEAPRTESPEVAAVGGAEVGAVPEGGASIEVEPTPGVAGTTAESVCAQPRGGLVELAVDECVLGDGVRVTALLPSRLRWDASTVEVQAGELLFDVAPRPGRPLHVALGTLDIEVVGTRFIVHSEGTEGWVSMLEGHVRTRVGAGPAQDLRGGERLEWPGPATEREATPARPSRPSASKAAEPDEGLAELLDEVAALRRGGAYREAVERLRSSDARRWSPRARQLVSYEIGTLLERQLGDVAQACAHWAEHRRRYPNGRHDAIVVRSMERLRCDERAE